jgi:uncharacterized protein (DUF433 family)
MAHPRIEIHADVMGGKPVIEGTRIPVELIVRKLSEGADRVGFPVPGDMRVQEQG